MTVCKVTYLWVSTTVSPADGCMTDNRTSGDASVSSGSVCGGASPGPGVQTTPDVSETEAGEGPEGGGESTWAPTLSVEAGDEVSEGPGFPRDFFLERVDMDV